MGVRVIMQPLMDPFSLALDRGSGDLSPITSAMRRRLSDMRGMYADAVAERALAEDGDPLIYEVLQHETPNVAGQLLVCTTRLYPGTVGDEYFMTKGHYHQKLDTAEVYLGLHGHGRLLLQSHDDLRDLEMRPGSIAYIPPYWAHRTVNTGNEPLIFLAVCPADAGHEYGTIERDGFAGRVLARDGAPTVVRAPAKGA